MTLNLLSISLSFSLNLFLLTLLITGLTFPVKKKEEIKITLLEPSSFEVTTPKTLSPLENFPHPTPTISKPRSAPEIKTEIKSEVGKRETSKAKEKEIPKRESQEEEGFLRKRLLALQKSGPKDKNLSEEENLLRDRLNALQKERSLKTTEGSFPSLGQFQGKESANPSFTGKLSEEYLLLIKRKLQTHFEVPIYLKNRGNLSALVEIQVSSSGEITKISFLKKSEDPTFNQAVEKCLASVNPLPVNKSTSLKIEFKAQGITKVF